MIYINTSLDNAKKETTCSKIYKMQSRKNWNNSQTNIAIVEKYLELYSVTNDDDLSSLQKNKLIVW